MKIIAVLTKPLKIGIKTISGMVVQDGMGHITIAVTDKDGNRNIKRFKKADYTINYMY